jgi:transcriptional antiterminator NusG
MAKRWYSVSVLSNFEKRIAEQIRTAVAEKGLRTSSKRFWCPKRT